MLDQDARSVVGLSTISPKSVVETLVHESIDRKVLPTMLSVIAGSTDVISFLGLAGLFTAHITGNLILIAARIVNGSEASVAHILAVPVFILALALTRLLVHGLTAIGRPTLRPLLALQFLLLSGFLTFSVITGPHVDPSTPEAIFAGMLGVSAMAVQNGLVQLSLRGIPSTAMMTTNITRFTLEFVEVLIGRDPEDVAKSRQQTKLYFLAILGFTAGAAIGALAFRLLAFWSLLIPTALAALTVVMSLMTNPKASETV